MIDLAHYPNFKFALPHSTFPFLASTSSVLGVSLIDVFLSGF